MKTIDFMLIKRLTIKNCDSVELIKNNLICISDTLNKANLNGENLKPSQRDEILEYAIKFNDSFKDLMEVIAKQQNRRVN